MPKRSAILQLPARLRNQLDRRLIATQFSRYAEHARWLTEKNYPTSQSGLGRYGVRLKRQLQASFIGVGGEIHKATRRGRILVVLINVGTGETRTYSAAVSAWPRVEQALLQKGQDRR